MKSLPSLDFSPRLPKRARKPLNWFTCLAASAIATFMTSAAIAAPSTSIVISQVYGGGGNSGATYNNDFVELHNISGSSVVVDNWTVQYATSSGTTWTPVALTGSIASGGYYLVQFGGGSTTTTSPLPTPDATGSSNFAVTGGKIALSNTSTALSGANPIGGPTIVDFVGYGSADAKEGTAAAGAASGNVNSVKRKDFGSQDTDQNSVDFEIGVATARNSSSPTYLPPADNTAPSITSRIPAVSATDVSINTSVSITFDEAILAGAGTVHLFKEAGLSDVSIPIGAVSISPPTTASFTPTAPLEPGETYYVLIDGTAFTDAATSPNAFPGISDESAWTFTTEAAPVLDTFLVGNGAANTATPNVTLNYTSSGGTPTEYIASELSDFSDASWTALPASTRTLSAGNGTKTVYFKLRNSAGETAVLSDTIERVSYSNPGTLIITQYYESTAATDKYIEITNTTASPVDLTGWHLVRWANDQAQAWKVTGSSISGSSDDYALSGTIAAGQAAVFANPSAVTPILAASAFAADSKINHNGNDSYGLYQGAVSPENLRDAIGFTNLGDEGKDTSFTRISSAAGFNFTIGSTVLDFPAVWQEVDLATVDAAVSGENAYLGTYPGTLSSSGYSSWAGTYVEDQTADLDYDGDGLDNGTEYFMGTDPAGFTPNPGFVSGTITWPRAAGTTIASFQVEVSTNLTLWENAEVSYGDFLTISETEITFAPPTPTSGKLFVRLSVTP